MTDHVTHGTSLRAGAEKNRAVLRGLTPLGYGPNPHLHLAFYVTGGFKLILFGSFGLNAAIGLAAGTKKQQDSRSRQGERYLRG